MIDLLQRWRSFWSRRTAKQLIAQQLPRGLHAPLQLLSLRVPPEVAESFSEYRALPLGAQAIRGQPPGVLLRLPALPPPPLDLAVLREPKLSAPLAAQPRPPRLLELPPALRTRVQNLGVARPRSFRLDGDLRLPAETEPLRISSDAKPLPKLRRVRPRTPLARAPLERLRPRSLRLDPRTLSPANEGIVPLQQPELTWRWVRPDFRREIVDLQWMAQERIAFMGMQPVEWFTLWWFQTAHKSPGAREAILYELPRELEVALEAVKEQMLLRRDVKKDETQLEPGRFETEEVGISMGHVEQVPLTSLIPPKTWIEAGIDLPPLPFAARARDAYLQWRTLINALEER
jgi:hypothetical protein